MKGLNAVKRVLVLFLAVALLLVQTTSALAKREVNSADYDCATDFLADIETGTIVSYDAILSTTSPYVDEDTFCISYPLLPWVDMGNAPMGGVYAREEDIGDIYAYPFGEERVTAYVHIVGVAEGVPKYDSFYVYIMDGQGSMELIDPETTTYCLDDENDVEALKKKAINLLDNFEIKQGTVIKTDDTNVNLNHYQVWVSCGEYTVYFQTKEKQFFVDDCVTGIGKYADFKQDGSVMIRDAEITLIP